MAALVLALAVGSMAAMEPARAVEPAATIVLVAYDSETGNTEALGRALAEGVASVEGVESVLRRISAVTDEEILRADGILVGTPVIWGSLSAGAKGFLDRVGRVLDEEIHGEGRTAGAFCTGGAPAAGKELARLAILAAFLNMRFTVIGGLELDGFGSLGAGATTGPSDPGLSTAELETARRSGERFARITAQIRRSPGA
ncbi:MAG: NAD(P)H-dependent oxidoreductase [Acidobacteriota bacterium]|nr:NAD(P)H-dependent oxidoreductase [Acidobacteriota bacterium]